MRRYPFRRLPPRITSQDFANAIPTNRTAHSYPPPPQPVPPPETFQPPPPQPPRVPLAPADADEVLSIVAAAVELANDVAAAKAAAATAAAPPPPPPQLQPPPAPPGAAERPCRDTSDIPAEKIPTSLNRTPRKKLSRKAPSAHVRLGPIEESALLNHECRCTICRHPDRDAIEQEFLDWNLPRDIAYHYKLSHGSLVYRHAHAVGLFERRRRQVSAALEYIVERASQVHPTADGVIRAVRALSCLNAEGVWTELPARVIFSASAPAPPVNVAQPATPCLAAAPTITISPQPHASAKKPAKKRVQTKHVNRKRV